MAGVPAADRPECQSKVGRAGGRCKRNGRPDMGVHGAGKDGNSRLSAAAKCVYASGDLTANAALAAVSLVFAPFFLIEVAGLRPALAGLVPLVGRLVDALTDPLMGRISDATAWRWGRRRPYFLLGAVPFGASFALLWTTPPLPGDLSRFAFYAAAYSALAVSMTVVSVPYLALIPEMALDYDERTSLNTYRGAAAIVGILVALALRPLAERLGGGAQGFAAAGLVMGACLAAPWAGVFAVSFERPEHRARRASIPLMRGIAVAMANPTFRRLTMLYLCGRVAIDLVAAMLLLYFTHWIGRSSDFEPLMAVFLLTVVAVLPAWLAIAKRLEKATVFTLGATWWLCAQMVLLAGQPSWPRWLFFACFAATAVGYAVVDLMPWAMIGDVIDEDDLVTAERREGLYNGVFLFLRKLSGAVAVFAALGVLDLAGLESGRPAPPGALRAIRLLASVAPALWLAAAIGFARGYPLTRERHRALRERIEKRSGRGAQSSVTLQ